MRYINLAELQVDDNWQHKAHAALEEARRITNHEDRADYIDRKSNLWASLKPKLEELSNGKCWYCESRERRSDRNVDHYRPKNNVRDSNPPHSGYWWLAFDYNNFRLSCTFCNQRRADRATGEVGGKWDYFPLYDEGRRVFSEGQSFRNENPLLLDPCVLTDVGLLDYADDGRIKPKYDKDKESLAFKRADESIKCYNLNEKEIVEARQAIYADIKGLIDDGDYHFEDSLNGEPNAKHALTQVIVNLAKLVTREAQFSEFARAIIAGFRSRQRMWMSLIDQVEVS